MKNSEKKEWQQVAEVKLSYHPAYRTTAMPKLRELDDVVNTLRTIWDEDAINIVEDFWILFVDNGSNLLGCQHVSRGGYNSCIVDPKVVFAAALAAKASGIILAHNHPSGKTSPSERDISLTQKLVEIGNILDLQVLDHIILTANDHYSFVWNWMMPRS